MRDLHKADLHAHLNGSVPPDTIRMLVRRHSVTLPDDFDLDEHLTLVAPVKSLQEYFRPWQAFKRLPIGQDCLTTMVDAAVRVAQHDGVRYIEFRNSPFYIAHLNSTTLATSLEWLCESLESAHERHGVDGRLILSITRHEFDPSDAVSLRSAISQVANRRRIVGLDLAGDEDIPVPHELARFFCDAKEDLGLGITIHAGETGSLENLGWAIEHCRADRIGHGLAAAACPRTLELLHREDICLEVCLSSNVFSGQVRTIEEHPIREFIKFGVPFVLCSDNPQVHSRALSDEYELFVTHFGERSALDDMYTKQMRYSFAS